MRKKKNYLLLDLISFFKLACIWAIGGAMGYVLAIHWFG